MSGRIEKRNLASGESAQRTSTSNLHVLGLALLCAKVATVPLLFDYSLDTPFTVMKALISHGFTYALVATMVAVFVGAGARAFVWSWLHVPVIAFLCANVAATVAAEDGVLALYGAHVRMLGLGTVVDWVVLYFAVVLFVRSRVDSVVLVASAMLATLPVLAYEILQLVGRDPFRWTIDVTQRPFSTFGQATTLAHYLVVLSMGSLALAVLVRQMGSRLRLLLLLHAALLLFGAVMTGTRSPLLGLAVGISALLLFALVSHKDARARAVVLAGVALTAIALVGLLLATPLGQRFASTIEAPTAQDAADELVARLEPSAAGRLELYEIGWAMFQARPMLGYGPDNFAAGVPEFRREGSLFVRQNLPTSSHSWLAYVATGSGLLGLLSFLAISLVAIILAAKKGLKPMAAVGLVTAGTFLGTGLTTITDIGTDWLFWGSIGIVARATLDEPLSLPRHKSSGKRNRRVDRAGRVRQRVALIIAVAGLVSSLSVLPALDASRSARQSSDARLQGNVVRAVERGLHATQTDSGRPEYWHGLGLAYVASSRWTDAIASFERARTLAPYDVRHIGDLARAWLFVPLTLDSGAPMRSLELADRAVATDPNNPLAHLTRAVIMHATGRLEDASASADRALALDPGSSNPQLYLTAVQIALAANRPEKAIQVARLGIPAVGQPRASVPLRVELARALLLLGQRADAAVELDEALAINPSDTAAQRLRAEIRNQN